MSHTQPHNGGKGKIQGWGTSKPVDTFTNSLSSIQITEKNKEWLLTPDHPNYQMEMLKIHGGYPINGESWQGHNRDIPPSLALASTDSWNPPAIQDAPAAPGWNCSVQRTVTAPAHVIEAVEDPWGGTATVESSNPWAISDSPYSAGGKAAPRGSPVLPSLPEVGPDPRFEGKGKAFGIDPPRRNQRWLRAMEERQEDIRQLIRMGVSDIDVYERSMVELLREQSEDTIFKQGK